MSSNLLRHGVVLLLFAFAMVFPTIIVVESFRRKGGYSDHFESVPVKSIIIASILAVGTLALFCLVVVPLLSASLGWALSKVYDRIDFMDRSKTLMEIRTRAIDECRESRSDVIVVGSQSSESEYSKTDA